MKREVGEKRTLSSCVPSGVWCVIMIEQGVLSGALLTNTPQIDGGGSPAVKPSVSSAGINTHTRVHAGHTHRHASTSHVPTRQQ